MIKNKDESIVIQKVTEQSNIKDIKINDINLQDNYKTARNENIDINNTFEKLINTQLNISGINNDNVFIKREDARPLYNLV